MQTYKEFRPTAFDTAGLGLHDQQNWLVAPVSQTRDSGPLERANFDAFLRALGGESETVEVHRFGHWGPGWFEIILIDPTDEPRVTEATELADALEDYPVVSDELYSQYEYEECRETWENCFRPSDRLNYFRRHSYTAQSIGGLLRAIKGGNWYEAANMLHCPSDLVDA